MKKTIVLALTYTALASSPIFLTGCGEGMQDFFTDSPRYIYPAVPPSVQQGNTVRTYQQVERNRPASKAICPAKPQTQRSKTTINNRAAAVPLTPPSVPTTRSTTETTTTTTTTQVKPTPPVAPKLVPPSVSQ